MMYSKLLAAAARAHGITFDLGEGPVAAIVDGVTAYAELGPWDHTVTATGVTVAIGADSHFHPFASPVTLPVGMSYRHTLAF